MREAPEAGMGGVTVVGESNEGLLLATWKGRIGAGLDSLRE